MIVVTGATGNVGWPLVTLLTGAGQVVTAVSRRAPAGHLPAGARHWPADLADPGSLRPALDGTSALFLLLGHGELDLDRILGLARDGGVRRVVLLTAQLAGTRPDDPAFGQFRAREAAVAESGLDWAVLRPGGFTTNTLAWAGQVRARRTVAAPFGDTGLPVIDPADIAEVAALLLRDGAPAVITPREQAQAIGDALGERVRFAEQSRDEARAELMRHMPGPVADAILDVLGQPAAAEQKVSPDASQLLGREPRCFADWAAANVAAFR